MNEKKIATSISSPFHNVLKSLLTRGLSNSELLGKGVIQLGYLKCEESSAMGDK